MLTFWASSDSGLGFAFISSSKHDKKKNTGRFSRVGEMLTRVGVCFRSGTVTASSYGLGCWSFSICALCKRVFISSSIVTGN
ncbi:hypothetical protein HanRHA438_Chr07g0299131 [Helianthus annuus]|nr:hypothetical protein HanRHA438_Chr07g0299131 [Helianthus annuus]